MNKKDTLFLLKPGFFDNGKGPFFCPYCAQVVGLLEFYPELKQYLDIQYLDFPRPRAALVELLGAENQGCPVLVLKASENPGSDTHVQSANGHFFVEGPNEIAEYLASIHHTGIPH